MRPTPPVPSVKSKSSVSPSPELRAPGPRPPDLLRPPVVKVCGITRAQDAASCLRLGVRFMGVNRYEPSPRCVPVDRLAELLTHIPVGRRVYVDVNPGLPELHAAEAAGFDFFQIHFDPHMVDERRLAMWKEKVGAARLWLAPRLKGGTAMPHYAYDYASTFLIDGYSAGAFGGTGKTADWAAVAALRSLHREKTWIVAGGLGPDNIVEAVRASHADIVDLNSGVESAPGIKEESRLSLALDRLAREIGIRT